MKFRANQLKCTRLLVVGLVALTLFISACSSNGSSSSSNAVAPVVVNGQLPRFEEPVTLRVVTHDSFAMSDSVKAEFENATNIKLELVPSGDAVTMVNSSILTAGSPNGDVLFGIDDNLLSRAFAADLFIPYTAAGLSNVDSQFRTDTKNMVTPIDHGDVCLNVDRRKISAPPTSLQDLLSTKFANSVVVQDPTSSTPGLAFLLATIATFGGGDDTSSNAAWLEYWKDLKSNGVKISPDWETAYYGEFSGGSGQGSYPIVVSYASSPPAEVTDINLAVDAAPTGVVAASCYRQIEYAGILRGAKHPEAAAAFIEYMLQPEFQKDVPNQMYVYPVVKDTPLPPIFEKFTAKISDPLQIEYRQVEQNRERWLQQWASVFR